MRGKSGGLLASLSVVMAMLHWAAPKPASAGAPPPVPRREAEGPPDPHFALRLLRKLAKKHNYNPPSRPGPELPEPPELPELPLTPSGWVSKVPLIARRAFILRRSDSRADSDRDRRLARVALGHTRLGLASRNSGQPEKGMKLCAHVYLVNFYVYPADRRLPCPN